LYPTYEQEIYFKKACGIKRFTYNWALNEWNKEYEKYIKNKKSCKAPNHRILRDRFTKLKNNKEELSFINEVSKYAFSNAFEDLGNSFKRLFNKQGKYPKFKSKKRSKDSFREDAATKFSIKVKDYSLFIPKWQKKPIKLAERLRYPNGRIKSCTISRTADIWFTSILVELDKQPKDELKRYKKTKDKIGIDLGIKTYATLSNGKKIKIKNKMKLRLKRLDRKVNVLQEVLSKKSKISNNREKVKTKLSRCYYKIKCIKEDFLHKKSQHLVRKYNSICMEDLTLKNMMKNHKLAKSLQESMFRTFIDYVDYKSKRKHNVILILADSKYPSTQLCSGCGNRKIGKDKMKLKDREYICTKCGLIIDRDLNASINLEKLI